MPFCPLALPRVECSSNLLLVSFCFVSCLFSFGYLARFWDICCCCAKTTVSPGTSTIFVNGFPFTNCCASINCRGRINGYIPPPLPPRKTSQLTPPQTQDGELNTKSSWSLARPVTVPTRSLSPCLFCIFDTRSTHTPQVYHLHTQYTFRTSERRTGQLNGTPSQRHMSA